MAFESGILMRMSGNEAGDVFRAYLVCHPLSGLLGPHRLIHAQSRLGWQRREAKSDYGK